MEILAYVLSPPSLKKIYNFFTHPGDQSTVPLRSIYSKFFTHQKPTNHQINVLPSTPKQLLNSIRPTRIPEHLQHGAKGNEPPADKDQKGSSNFLASRPPPVPACLFFVLLFNVAAYRPVETTHCLYDLLYRTTCWFTLRNRSR